MRDALRVLLADPRDGGQLELVAGEQAGGDVLTGSLRAGDGFAYPIRAGIPRFSQAAPTPQGQTSDSFGYKWTRTDTYLSPAMQAMGQRWLVERYGFGSVEEMRRHFESSPAMLDLGCGGGYTAQLWMGDRWQGRTWVGLDISEAIDVAAERLGPRGVTGFVQADGLHLPFAPGTFSTVLAEGVLHHTPSTRDALASAVRALAPGGEALFYVYRRKGPIREFVDDHVRRQIADLPPGEAWRQLEPLTRLGQVLAEANVTITIPEDIPLLEIPAGSYDLQRFFYWHVAKLFWNADMPFEENHHINFDWYHPAFAHRQSEAEVRGWCDELGLRITHLDAQESGFTVRAVLDGVPAATRAAVTAAR